MRLSDLETKMSSSKLLSPAISKQFLKKWRDGSASTMRLKRELKVGLQEEVLKVVRGIATEVGNIRGDKQSLSSAAKSMERCKTRMVESNNDLIRGINGITG